MKLQKSSEIESKDDFEGKKVKVQKVKLAVQIKNSKSIYEEGKYEGIRQDQKRVFVRIFNEGLDK